MTPDQRALTLPDFEQLEKCPDSPALRGGKGSSATC